MRIQVLWGVKLLVVTDVLKATGTFGTWVNTNPGTRCHSQQNLNPQKHSCKSAKSRVIL